MIKIKRNVLETSIKQFASNLNLRSPKGFKDLHLNCLKILDKVHFNSILSKHIIKLQIQKIKELLNASLKPPIILIQVFIYSLYNQGNIMMRKININFR